MDFKRVQSLCADCGRPVPAEYVRQGDTVFLEKVCPEHGISRTLASENAEVFDRWLSFSSVTIPPRVFVTKGAVQGKNIVGTECPLHCGVCENHLMTACCVLLNVTEHCNQRCPYCFANAGQAKTDDPPLADIGRWLDRLVELGEERKFNIQLSGGEPTMRDDLADIIRMCKTKDFEYIQLNTNGKKLAEDPSYAKRLKTAGLSTVFLQFDGVDDDVYLALRGEPLFDIKKTAIRNCGAAGLSVTLVPTVLKRVNLSQVGRLIEFMIEHIAIVKGVHFQPVSFFGRTPDERNINGDFEERVTMFSVMDEIEKQTDGLVKTSDLAPISTGHPLCCFCAAFIKEPGPKVRPLSSGGSCCVETVDSLEVIRRDRDFVLNKWDINVPAPSADAGSFCCEKSDDTIMSFDEALTMFKNNMFTISGMAFMDETNLDAERLRRCRVQVFTPDERLVPFCGYYTKRS